MEFPFFIFDGNISTENAGYVLASFLYIPAGFGIETLAGGRFNVRRLSDDLKTQNMDEVGVTGAVNSVTFNHGLLGTPWIVNATPHQSGCGEVWISNRTATQITISFTNQPGGATWVFSWWATV